MAIELHLGDITQLKVTAIVNAANSGLWAGSGVCGAIHRAAGPELAKECLSLGGCPVGEAVLTGGYNLKAKYVIHAVGPNYHGSPATAPSLLSQVYRSIFKICQEQGIQTVAIPCISTGVYGFPKQQAAEIAVGAALENSGLPSKIIFCCFEPEDHEIYRRLLG